MLDNKDVKKIIKNNFITIIFSFIIFLGLFYIEIYYFNFSFFPLLSNEDFIQLSLLYFSIISISSLIFTLLFFFPGEQIYQLLNNESIVEKLFALFILILILFIPISYFIMMWNFLKENNNIDFLTKNWFIIIIVLIILATSFIFNYIYYQTKKNNDKKNLIFLIFIVWFITLTLLIPFFSKTTTRIFHLGNYKAIVIINNKNICQIISKHKRNNKTCLYPAYIIWNMGNNYLIEINNTRYKIPSKYILMEYFVNSKKDKTKKE